MSQPTRGDVHVNRPLTNVSIAFIQSHDKFVASRMYPNLPVKNQGNIFTVYPSGAWFRDEAKERGPSTESAGGGFDIDQSNTYFAKKYAFHKDVDDDVRANADENINVDRDATEFVTQKMLIRKEVQWAADNFKTGIWTGSSTGGDIVPGILWDVAGSDPIDDVLKEMDAQEEKTGFRPNRMVVTPKVHRALRTNAAVLDRITGAGSADKPALVTANLLASLFEVDEYMVARATNNLGKEGAADNFKFIFGSGAGQLLLAFVQPTPGLMKPSAGYTFTWKGFSGAGPAGNRIKKFRMEKLGSDRIEGEIAFDPKQIAADLGVFFTGVTA